MELKNSFVAMFDYIGFKQARAERGTDGLFQLYKKALLPFIEHSAAQKFKKVYRDGSGVLVPDPSPNSIEYRIVSDSILLFPAGDSFLDFLRLVRSSHMLLSSGFAGHRIPLRGCIGHGDLIFDQNSIWLGSAIEDAYQGEQSQCWAGCALSEGAEVFCRERGFIESYKRTFLEGEAHDEVRKSILLQESRRLVEYDVPMQRRDQYPVSYYTRCGIAIDWTLNVFSGAASKTFSPSESTHAKRIKENTERFELWARQLHVDSVTN